MDLARDPPHCSLSLLIRRPDPKGIFPAAHAQTVRQKPLNHDCASGAEVAKCGNRRSSLSESAGSGKHCMLLGLNGYQHAMREFVYHRPTSRTDRFIRQKLSSRRSAHTDLSSAVWPVCGMACRPSIGD